MYFVIALDRAEAFREEGDRVPLVVFLGQLRQDGSGCVIGAVGFDPEWFVVSWEHQNQSGGDPASEFIEGLFLFFFPFPRCIPCNVVEWPCDVGEVLYEPTVEVNKANNLLYFLLGLRRWPLRNSGHLDWIHLYLSVRNDESQILNASPFEFALVRMKTELVFSEYVEDFLDYPAMFLQVPSKDQYVIDIDTYHSSADKVLEYVVHHGLECSWTVSHSI